MTASDNEINNTITVQSNFYEDEGVGFEQARKAFKKTFGGEKVIHVQVVEMDEDEPFYFDVSITVEQAVELMKKLTEAVELIIKE